MTKNITKLTYSYTDASGRSVDGALYLNGRLHNHGIMEIESRLVNRNDFIPGALDLEIDELQAKLSSFPSIHDHVFHTFDFEKVDYLESAPEGAKVLELADFLSAFNAIEQWDVPSAESRLGVGSFFKGKAYELTVRCGADLVKAPTQARFHILEVDAERIIQLSQVAIEHGLYKVERFDYRTTWLEGDSDDGDLKEVNSDLDLLNISASEFWFSAYVKHTGIEIITERKPISDLREWLGLNDQNKVDANAVGKPRVLVVVTGGSAEAISDSGVEVVVFDWDNYEANPAATGGVPDHFSDIAALSGIPLASQAVPVLNRAADRERG